ncbi:MAG: phosphatase PAP2 family protein [Candidatus Cloacimonetes bacterium]|nr:phosphatase PAP2 family protein [Candidatus Cloacimonadota bacterium]
MKRKSNYRPIDYLVLIYCILNILYIFLGIILHGAGSEFLHQPLKHLAIFCGIILLVVCLERWEQHKEGRFISLLRDWYAITLFLYFFEATSALNRTIFPEFIDGFFMRIDALIFGYQPALEWGLKHDSWFLSELFHFAYFSYYLMGVFYLFVYLKKRELFLRYAFQLAFVFFVCYLTFNVLPVVGGRNLEGMMKLAETYRHGPFTHVMAFIYRMSPHKGGAFPSSHVAVALVVNLSAFHYRKQTGWLLLPLVTLLTISTVYCHYHYFIDTIFGLLYGLGFYYLSGRIYENMLKSGRINV